MIIGIIDSKSFLKHPITIIRDYGVNCWFHGLIAVCSSKRVTWLQLVMQYGQ